MIKNFLRFWMVVFLPAKSFCQSWQSFQLDSANTAKNVNYLSEEEKKLIMYINLARLYPEQFGSIELQEEGDSRRRNSGNKRSLLKDLKRTSPAGALQVDESMYNIAVCFAKESGASGYVGHQRKNCGYGYLGECCSYGVGTGRQIALQWLIDEGTSDLGHRKICLAKNLTRIGVAIHDHKSWNKCSVADFH